MAAYIPVPRDLTKVKSKILFNLTKRQLICFGAAALIGVPSFFLLKKLGNVSLAVIVKHIIETRFIRPKIRPYQTDNYYVILHRQAIAQKEVEKIVFHSEKAGKAKRKASGKPDKKRKKAGAADRRSGKKK